MAKKDRTRKHALSAEDLAELKALLLAKRSEILSTVGSMEDETLRKPRTDLSNMPFHMADLGTDNYELENTLGLMDSERKLLAEIQDALAHMEDGTYGTCEANGEHIPKTRLFAIPWARYCVACASLMEKGLLFKKERTEVSAEVEDMYADRDESEEEAQQ